MREAYYFWLSFGDIATRTTLQSPQNERRNSEQTVLLPSSSPSLCEWKRLKSTPVEKHQDSSSENADLRIFSGGARSTRFETNRTSRLAHRALLEHIKIGEDELVCRWEQEKRKHNLSGSNRCNEWSIRTWCLARTCIHFPNACGTSSGLRMESDDWGFHYRDQIGL